MAEKKTPRKKPFPANAASVKYLREQGMLANVVEQRIPHCFITRDLFGCIDIVALDFDGLAIIGVQATTGANHAARRTKILATPAAKSWLVCGGRLAIHSWSVKAGSRSHELRVEWLGLEDFITEKDV